MKKISTKANEIEGEAKGAKKNRCAKTRKFISKKKNLLQQYAIDLPECECKLAKNFMISHVIWINKNNASQWFHFSFTAYDVACTQIQCQH